jgi:microcystin-dependent protein
MTRARDLADLISGGFNAAKIPNLDASKITTGSLDSGRIPSLDTSKITSGTFADAFIANVSSSKLTGALPALDGSSLTGIEGTKTGTIMAWSSSSIPTGFLECDGTAVSRTTYATLFAEIGTLYGVGDGSTTFNLPDLQDNVPLGKSGTKSLASTGGANTVTPTGNISGSTANATLSTSQLASHSHTVLRSDVFGGLTKQIAHTANGSNQANENTGNSGSGSGHSHNMSANFSGTASSVVQPYLTVIYIIKT